MKIDSNLINNKYKLKVIKFKAFGHITDIMK